MNAGVAPARRLDPTILREYDIRGIVGETLNEDDARAIGAAFATMLVEQGAKDVCVGRDGRLSSPALEDALCDGLASAGLKAIRIGLGPTPMMYYGVNRLGTGGGIAVSGSHNPPNYNGFKMMIGTKPFYGADIQRLGEIAASAAFATGAGRSEEHALLDDYVARILADVRPGKALKVAWDAGNGAAGPAMQKLCAELPGTHLMINEQADGTFPNHHPDPTVPENLVQLQELVAREGCDLGIAFDGDGDRLGVIDGKGRILWGDQLMVLLSADVLARNPGATIIADVKASQALFDEIARMGGTPLMWRTGHSLIKAKMAEIGAPLAGEMSGHIFFADGYYGFDDALYAAVRLLNHVAAADQSVAEMRDALPSLVNTPELRFPCAEDRKFEVAGEIKSRLEGSGAKVNDTDGVRVMNEDGWWLLRPSNTQDVLVARCESASESGLARLKAALADQLRQSGIEPPAF